MAKSGSRFVPRGRQSRHQAASSRSVRSQTAATKSSSWLTTISLAPAAALARRASARWRTPAGSRLLVGSSSSTASPAPAGRPTGCGTGAGRRTAGRDAGRDVRQTRAADHPRWPRSAPAARGRERHPAMSGCCCVCSVTCSCGDLRISPEKMRTPPAIAPSSVDLPQPLGPAIPSISPGPRMKETGPQTGTA